MTIHRRRAGCCGIDFPAGRWRAPWRVVLAGRVSRPGCPGPDGGVFGGGEHRLQSGHVGGVIGQLGGDDQLVFAGHVLGVVPLGEPAAAHRHQPRVRVGDVPHRAGALTVLFPLRSPALCPGPVKGSPPRQRITTTTGKTQPCQRITITAGKTRRARSANSATARGKRRFSQKQPGQPRRPVPDVLSQKRLHPPRRGMPTRSAGCQHDLRSPGSASSAPTSRTPARAARAAHREVLPATCQLTTMAPAGHLLILSRHKA